MILGTVVGEIYSTINHAICEDQKLLVVDKIKPDGKPTGRKHKQLHLVCYSITTKLAGQSVRADYHNQFEGKPKARGTWGRVRVDAPVELCLPSYKALTSE